MPSLVVAHAFVTGGQGSDSERALTVGGSAEVSLGAFAGFDYAALGHLHRPQSLGRGLVRYAGSPLSYSFAESVSRKTVWIVDLPRGGAASVEPVELPLPRPLCTVVGPLDELLASPRWTGAEAGWVQAIVTDPVVAPDAVARLRRRFPFLALVVPRPPAASVEGVTYVSRTRHRSDADLFRGFWEHTTGEGPDDLVLQCFADALEPPCDDAARVAEDDAAA